MFPISPLRLWISSRVVTRSRYCSWSGDTRVRPSIMSLSFDLILATLMRRYRIGRTRAWPNTQVRNAAA